MAHTQYQTAVFSFAQDLQVAEKQRSRDDEYWVRSGLCRTQEDSFAAFALADTVVEDLKRTSLSNLAAKSFQTHGHFLKFLGHLVGELTSPLPAVPEPPTFVDKHAPYAASTVPDEDEPVEVVDAMEVEVPTVASSTGPRFPIRIPPLRTGMTTHREPPPSTPSHTQGSAPRTPGDFLPSSSIPSRVSTPSPPPIPSSLKGKGKAVEVEESHPAPPVPANSGTVFPPDVMRAFTLLLALSNTKSKDSQPTTTTPTSAPNAGTSTDPA